MKYGTGIPVKLLEPNATVSVGGSACNGAVLLAETNAGNIPASTPLTWQQKTLNLTIPQNQDSIVLILRKNGPGGCGNDLRNR